MAFVDLTGPASDEFFAQNKMPAAPVNGYPKEFRVDGEIYAPKAKPLHHFWELEKRQSYLKVGRTTGLTAGRCNCTIAWCNWAEKDRDPGMMRKERKSTTRQPRP